MTAKTRKRRPTAPATVELTLAEACALRAVVLGDAFDTKPIESALKKIEIAKYGEEQT